MNGPSYIIENLVGAWNVMLGRAEGLNRIDVSLEGFWRSFAAVALIAPFALIILISQRKLSVAAGDALDPLTGGVIAGEGLVLLVDWFTFPLIFALLAGLFGLGSRYVPFIVTRNWASLIIAAGVAVVHALHVIGLLPSSVAPFVMLIALAVALRFSYVIARVALAVSAGLALPIVALDFIVSLMIWAAFDQLT